MGSLVLVVLDVASLENRTLGRACNWLRVAGPTLKDGQRNGKKGSDLVVPCSMGLDSSCLAGLAKVSRAVARQWSFMQSLQLVLGSWHAAREMWLDKK